MKNWRIKLSLFINYFVFAILLNSVGAVILQVQNNFGITPSAASVLELCKDLPIAIASFLIASFLTRFGYRKSMMFSLLIISIGCLGITFVPSFWGVKILFVLIGVTFAVIKVCTMATVGLISENKKEHVSFMNFLESFFMVGVLSGNFIFAAFVDNNDLKSTAWFNVYCILAGLTLVAFLMWLTSSLDESEAQAEEQYGFAEMFKLLWKPVVLVFILSAFIYVFIEQGIMTWLPTFNNKVLSLPTSLSLQMAAILAGATALGRFFGGVILKRVAWFPVLAICLVAAAALVLLAMPLAQGVDATKINGWQTAPMAAYVFPLIGLFLAPIYPSIISTILSSLPKSKHAMMGGLIVVFSALGGTAGSMITGFLFENLGGEKVFYFSLIPITLVLITLFIFNKFSKESIQN